MAGRPKKDNKAFLVRCLPSQIATVREFANSLSNNTTMEDPKEKAIELFNKFGSKDLALLCVEEILKLDLYASEQYYWKNVEKQFKQQYETSNN